MSSSRVVAIIQARMTSTRLPGKVLANLDGRPMLAQQIRRLELATRLDQIVVATTDRASDDRIYRLAKSLGVSVFRGSEHDVLDRFARAAVRYQADIAVRITADCPLLDPTIVDQVVAELELHPSSEYASNVIERSYPQGLDVEALRAETLARVEREATSQLAREHVTWHIVKEAPGSFERRSVVADDNYARLRWTVDTPQDLEFVRRVYRDLDLSATPSGYREILAHVLANPELQAINRDVVQKHL